LRCQGFFFRAPQECTNAPSLACGLVQHKVGLDLHLQGLLHSRIVCVRAGRPVWRARVRAGLHLEASAVRVRLYTEYVLLMRTPFMGCVNGREIC